MMETNKTINDTDVTTQTSKENDGWDLPISREEWEEIMREEQEREDIEYALAIEATILDELEAQREWEEYEMGWHPSGHLYY